MSLVPFFLAAGASASVFFSGYIFGIRKDRHLRAALRDEATRLAEVEAQGVAERERLQSDLQSAVRALAHRDAEADGLRVELAATNTSARKSDAPPKHFSFMDPGASIPDSDERPLVQALAGRAWSLRDLAELLDAIARQTGLTNVVLADDAGLPLAASPGTRNVDSIAATAALVLLQLERSEGLGGARPIACVILDDDHGQTIHRLFRTAPSGGDRGARFTISGCARGFEPSPTVLDGALPTLDRVLARDA